MSDQRRHRGPHPKDRELFDGMMVPLLRDATSDLAWLLSKNYAVASSIKLVGDRYALRARQRIAVTRCADADQLIARRLIRELSPLDLEDGELWIDGYNVLTSLEAALSGGVILHARDGCYRDMASMHGNYRKVEETLPALQLLGDVLSQCAVRKTQWLLDKPVSNSGRLKGILHDLAQVNGWSWTAELVPNPDSVLSHTEGIVATADSQILDQAKRWFNLARYTIDRQVKDAWIVDLSH